jgi:hypothetical protein
MATDFIAKKAGNAFFTDEVRLDPTVRGAMNYSTGGWYEGINKFLNGLFGGTWIGGEIVLTAESLSFEPDQLNRELLVDPPSFAVPLTAIRNIRLKHAFVTDIVEVGYDDGKLFRLRCFGAAAFAALIEQAWRGQTR